MPIATLSMPEDTSLRSENRDFLSDLRRNIASLERGNRGTVGVVGFGLPEIDDFLPCGGLYRDAVHEFFLVVVLRFWRFYSQLGSRDRSSGVSMILNATTHMVQGSRLWDWSQHV